MTIHTSPARQQFLALGAVLALAIPSWLFWRKD